MLILSSLNTMTKTNTFLLTLAGILFGIILVIIAFLVGMNVGESNANKMTVSSRSIYEKLTSSAFLTSKIAYLNQETTIEINNESEWSKLLWGQTLTAKGLIKVSVGIDLNEIKETDIAVDNNTKTITISLPQAEILNTELEGNIVTTNQRGILKLLLENDSDADYNLALQKLMSEAEAVLRNENIIFTDSFNHSSEIIKSLYQGTGYTVIIEQR